MIKTIGNPASWMMGVMYRSLVHGAEMSAEFGRRDSAGLPAVRRLGLADLGAVLRLGWRDFLAFRSDALMLVMIYPLIGLSLAWFAFHGNALHLLFPMIAGFSLLGPVAAIGLYEMSRQAERGAPVRWSAALGVLRAPALGAIVGLGLLILALFMTWMLVAGWIHDITLGPLARATVAGFMRDVFTTPAGWAMIVLGMGAGLIFASVALMVSVVSFPLLLDRHVGLPVAVMTSVRVALANPVPVAAWGAIIAGLLVLGALPFLAGLVVVLPVLGHASWHFYRRAVA